MATFNIDANNTTADGDLVKNAAVWELDGTGTLSGVVTVASTVLDSGSSSKGFDFASLVENSTGTESAGDYVDNESPTATATSEFSGDYVVENAFNTTLSANGNFTNNSWLSANGTITNQRIALDNLVASDLWGLQVSNGHQSGTITTTGAQNVKIYVSNNAADYNNTYGADTDLTLVYDGVFAEHPATDTDSFEQITFDTVENARYVIIDIADNYGYSQLICIRQIWLREATLQLPTLEYQYTTDAPASVFNGTYLSSAEFKATDLTGHQLLGLLVRVTGSDGWSLNSLAIDDFDHPANGTWNRYNTTHTGNVEASGSSWALTDSGDSSAEFVADMDAGAGFYWKHSTITNSITNPGRIACYGDSMTLGTGVPAGDSYPSQLADSLGINYTVINGGASGITPNQTAQNFIDAPEDYDSSLLVLWDAGDNHGGAANLISAFNSAIAAFTGTEYVVIGLCLTSDVSADNALIEAEYGSRFLDIKSVLVAASGQPNYDSLRVDSIHLNAAGNLIVAEQIESIIDGFFGVDFQYTTDVDATTYNGTWLTLAQIQSATDVASRYQKIKTRLRGGTGDTWDYTNIQTYDPTLYEYDANTTTATNMTQVGDTWVMDGTSAEIIIPVDAGFEWAVRHSTFDASYTYSYDDSSYEEISSPTARADSEFTASFAAEFAFDTDLSLIGAYNNTQWIAGNPIVANQRIALDLGAETLQYGLRISNAHNSGANTDWGVKDAKVYLSNNVADYNGAYGEDTALVQVYDGQFTQHVATNTVDWQSISYDTPTIGRYLIIDCTNNWGGTLIGIRAVEVNTNNVPTLTDRYQYTTDVDGLVYNGTNLTKTQLQNITDTDNQIENIKIILTGVAGDAFVNASFNIYNIDTTAPAVPTLTKFQIVGIDGNYGICGQWTEPTDSDFDHVEVEINVDDAGWELLDNTGDLGGLVSMQFNESLQGTQAQEEGWLYQSSYSRNGYIGGQTIQLRTASLDDKDNKSAYSTSNKLVAEGKPDSPSISIKDGDIGIGEVTITIDAADEADEIFVVYRTMPDGEWVLNASFSRIGDGTVTVTGLTNFTRYELSAYTNNGSCDSTWSSTVFAIPIDDTLPLHRQIQLAVAALIDSEGYQTSDSTTFTVSTDWPPRWDGKPVPTIFVQPDSFDSEPGSTSTLTRDYGINVAIFEQVKEANTQVENRMAIYEAIQGLLSANTRPVQKAYLSPDSFGDSRAYSASDVERYSFMTPFAVRYRARCNR